MKQSGEEDPHHLLSFAAMPYSKVIQDSDGEEGLDSDSATSVDPLQDQEPTVDAYNNLGPIVNRQRQEFKHIFGDFSVKNGIKTDLVQLPSSSGPPRVDFDQYLQSQPPVWAEQEVWPQRCEDERAGHSGTVEDEPLNEFRRSVSFSKQIEQLQVIVPINSNRVAMFEADCQKPVKRRKISCDPRSADRQSATEISELSSPHAYPFEFDITATNSKRSRRKQRSILETMDTENIHPHPYVIIGDMETQLETVMAQLPAGFSEEIEKAEKPVHNPSDDGIARQSVEGLPAENVSAKRKSKPERTTCGGAMKCSDTGVQDNVGNRLVYTIEDESTAKLGRERADQKTCETRAGNPAPAFDGINQSKGEDISTPGNISSSPKTRGRGRKPGLDAANAIPDCPPQKPEVHFGNRSEVLKDISAHQNLNDSGDNSSLQDGNAESFPCNDHQVTSPLLVSPPQKPTKCSGDEQVTFSPGSLHSLKKLAAEPCPMPQTSKAPFRVGLSRKARIAPLLKVVRK